MKKLCFGSVFAAVLLLIGGITAAGSYSVQLPQVQSLSPSLPQTVSASVTPCTVAAPAVESVSPAAPSVKSVSAGVPAVTQTALELPAVSGSEVVSEEIAVPAVAVAETAQYKVELPGGRTVTVTNPVAAAAVAAVPQLASLLTEKPTVTTAEIASFLAAIPEVTPAVVEKIAAQIPSVGDPAQRMALILEFMKECRKHFRDQRNLQADSSLFFDKESSRKWLAICKSGLSYQLNFVPLPENLRIVAEVHHPICAETLSRNLDFYCKRGYNGVLLTFGYNGETPDELTMAAELIRQKGMTVWIAFSGPEKLSHSVFPDPDELTEKLKTLAVLSQGFLIGWRRTSLHLFEQDAAFTAFMLKAVREGNPQIAVAGEAYYGQTASSKGQTRNLQYNVPGNASCVLVSGLGFNGVAVETVMEKLLAKVNSFPKMVLITGDTPYYATRQPNGKNFSENLKIKENLAQRWLAAGAGGIVILHGDGSDGIYNRSHNDNIAQMEVQQ